MSARRLEHRPPDNLIEVWPYIDWLDRAVGQQLANEAPIPGPIFERLKSPEKVLAHWLCYTMDAQMDYRRLWAFGGPVIAELVEEYSKGRKNPLDVLIGFTPRRVRAGKVSTLKAKKQIAGDDIPEITPRYQWMLFSIASR